MPRAPKSKKYLVWVDCEMTGLDPDRDRLLEIAVLITNYDLEIVARGPELAIRQSDARLKAMDVWNRRTHAKSGLIERVRTEGLDVEEAEREVLSFVKKYCYKKTAPLCGNSIGQDKSFLSRYMPKLVEYLHYRVIDVSTIKVLSREWYGGKYQPPDKPDVHRALADIEQSIEELRYYREHVFVRG